MKRAFLEFFDVRKIPAYPTVFVFYISLHLPVLKAFLVMRESLIHKGMPLYKHEAFTVSSCNDMSSTVLTQYYLCSHTYRTVYRVTRVDLPIEN